MNKRDTVFQRRLRFYKIYKQIVSKCQEKKLLMLLFSLYLYSKRKCVTIRLKIVKSIIAFISNFKPKN